MRVFTGGIVTETNTFAPFATALDDWNTSDDPGGSEMEDFFDLIAALAGERGWGTVRGFAAMAEPAGKTTAEAWKFLRGRLLEDLRSAMPVDLVVLPLHGAMVAEGCDDCEGDILALVRDIVGPDVPIGAGLDAHAHLTQKMVDAADILVFMKEWPHIDVPLTIENAFRLTAKVAEGRIEHTQPMIFSADETADVGIDLGTPVVETIGAEARSRFNGHIPKVTVEVHPMAPAEKAAGDAAVKKAHQKVHEVPPAAPSLPPSVEAASFAVYEPGVAGSVVVKTIEVSARVTAIDKVRREATLKRPDGSTLTVKVGPEAVNFDQVEVGLSCDVLCFFDGYHANIVPVGTDEAHLASANV